MVSKFLEAILQLKFCQNIVDNYQIPVCLIVEFEENLLELNLAHHLEANQKIVPKISKWKKLYRIYEKHKIYYESSHAPPSQLWGRGIGGHNFI